ncbi:hypothetical protein Tco_0890612 [Tanacetum coccineum]|uniref:Uncharacterized protein n=1 Tax=Tanacetum coccineum TaxID=301880 RepID=A0ABQ5C0W9_9ASTR
MIECKVMRTLASVEFESILILGLSCCPSSSSVRCLEKVDAPVRYRTWMSTLVFVDLEISTQANGAQSSRVPDPVETETPESPHTVASPTSLPDSTPPTCHAEETPRMVVRVPPAMSLGVSTSIAEVAAMSDLAFRKRFRSSYESLPSSSPPDLPLRKHSRGTSELVEDKEEDEEEEDEEVEVSSDSDSKSEAVGDEGLAAGDEGPDMRVESLGLEEDEVVPEGRQPVLALESWASQTDAQRAALWHAISDTQEENWELRLQLAKERHARLELAEIVDSMRGGQGPSRDV